MTRALSLTGRSRLDVRPPCANACLRMRIPPPCLRCARSSSHLMWTSPPFCLPIHDARARRNAHAAAVIRTFTHISICATVFISGHHHRDLFCVTRNRDRFAFLLSEYLSLRVVYCCLYSLKLFSILFSELSFFLSSVCLICLPVNY